MKTNVKPQKFTEKTHEGAPAARTNAEQQLRRSVMACMLFEGTFYESGEEIADRIKETIKLVKPEKVRDIAIEAREKQKLRHVPLLIARQMATLPTHRGYVAETLEKIIQRPDELSEFVSMYLGGADRKKTKQKLSAQVKKGLARAFNKFNEYSLAKYNGDAAIRLRDVLFMVHPTPKDEEQAAVWKRLAQKQLVTPDTWEVALSGGADKKEVFTRLMSEEKLGALAFLRNLRNMKESGVSESLVAQYSTVVDISRVLPFRFITAAKYVPEWEPMIEAMMLRALRGQPKLPGKTAIVVDNSGSMYNTKVSAKSELERVDAACALAILIREIAEVPLIIAFANGPTIIPARHGFALRDAIRTSPSGGTYTDKALAMAEGAGYDRVIVITDEQSHEKVRPPITDKAYFINVSVNKNGIGYGPWTHVDGWSEAVVDYIRAAENLGVDSSPTADE